ncbi:S53 family peptidase [Spirosoma rhododendri]|uniref:S8/S53 family peptidase n=1 Tax=Spirosoma rhododendri TaxID=2728024 RepID=A0A7L5DTE8_9BACT|nr:S53 family peptidase [Spirosoma rhododendri]QJD78830.1 S8/S53 family peptidase [Spirosoma rhododendri]
MPTSSRKNTPPTFGPLVPLPGSERPAPAATKSSLANSNESINVTIRLRRRQSINTLVNQSAAVAQPLNRSDYARQYGASPADMRLVVAYAAANGLTVVLKSTARRTVLVRGTVAQLSKAFGVTLNIYRLADGSTVRGRKGPVMVPDNLVASIEGVFGLDNRPQARAHFQIYNPGDAQGIANPRAVAASFTPPQLAKLYNYPTDRTGKGQTIAIIELGGGFRQADITAYFKSIGLKAPSVKAVLVDGGKNAPSNANGADGEVMLDIEVAGGIAPGANIVVYFAPNTDQGFLDAITTALHDARNKPSVISISWGSAEKSWTPQALNSFNQAFQSAAALGVTICAAAGDTGSDDSVGDKLAHVDFPASSPFVLACGGTKLLTTTNGTAISTETVWHESNTSATGGGISDVFDKPDYQAKASVPPSVNDGKRVGRGVPDVAAVADPATGYVVRVDGQNLVIGGTSAVAPLMAGLVALINEQRSQPVGFIHPKIYATPTVFRDVTQGDNITVTNSKGYSATTGWDACTGLGVADGQKLASLLTTVA